MQFIVSILGHTKITILHHRRNVTSKHGCQWKQTALQLSVYLELGGKRGRVGGVDLDGGKLLLACRFGCLCRRIILLNGLDGLAIVRINKVGSELKTLRVDIERYSKCRRTAEASKLAETSFSSSWAAFIAPICFDSLLTGAAATSSSTSTSSSSFDMLAWLE